MTLTAASRPAIAWPAPDPPRIRVRAVISNAPLVLAGLSLLGIAIFHLVVLVGPGEPSGLDYGNWQTLGHRWLHDAAPGGSESIYPPAVPILVVLAVHLFGPVWGEGVLSSIGALAPAIAVGVVLRGRVPRAVTAAAVVLIAAGQATGEAAAWGGLPQLLALGTALVSAWRLVLLLRRPTARDAWILSGWLFSTALISHLLFAQVAAVAALILLGHLTVIRRGVTLRGPWTGRDGTILLAARVVGPLLILAPLYVRLFHTVGASVASRSDSSVHTLLVSTSGVFRDAPWIWLPASALTALTPLLWSRRQDPLWLLVNAMTVAEAVTTLQTGEPRLIYLLPLDVVCALALWSKVLVDAVPRYTSHVRGARRVGLVALTAAVIVTSVAGLSEFPSQRIFYGNRLIPQGSVAAIEWLRANTPADALVAVPPVDGLPFGWWVEGLGHRATLTGSSETYLNFPDERSRAREAVALYSLGSSQTALLLQQCALTGITYLYIPTNWGGQTTSAAGALAVDQPARVVFANAGASILKVTP